MAPGGSCAYNKYRIMSGLEFLFHFFASRCQIVRDVFVEYLITWALIQVHNTCSVALADYLYGSF